MVRRLVSALRERTMRLGPRLAWQVVDNGRELLLLAGLVALHVGCRELEAWVPGLRWIVPGAIVTAIAVFGVRGQFALPPARKER